MERQKRKNTIKRIGIKPPAIFRPKVLSWIWEKLCWITNNETHPKYEVEFDVAFFIINTIAVILGCYYMIKDGKGSAPFSAMLIVEWTWALDTIRNNRTYIK